MLPKKGKVGRPKKIRNEQKLEFFKLKHQAQNRITARQSNYNSLLQSILNHPDNGDTEEALKQLTIFELKEHKKRLDAKHHNRQYTPTVTSERTRNKAIRKLDELSGGNQYENLKAMYADLPLGVIQDAIRAQKNRKDQELIKEYKQKLNENNEQEEEDNKEEEDGDDEVKMPIKEFLEKEKHQIESTAENKIKQDGYIDTVGVRPDNAFSEFSIMPADQNSLKDKPPPTNEEMKDTEMLIDRFIKEYKGIPDSNLPDFIDNDKAEMTEEDFEWYNRKFFSEDTDDESDEIDFNFDIDKEQKMREPPNKNDIIVGGDGDAIDDSVNNLYTPDVNESIESKHDIPGESLNNTIEENIRKGRGTSRTDMADIHGDMKNNRTGGDPASLDERDDLRRMMLNQNERINAMGEALGEAGYVMDEIMEGLGGFAGIEGLAEEFKDVKFSTSEMSKDLKEMRRMKHNKQMYGKRKTDETYLTSMAKLRGLQEKQTYDYKGRKNNVSLVRQSKAGHIKSVNELEPTI